MKYKITTRKALQKVTGVKQIADTGRSALPGVQPKVSKPKRAGANKMS